MPDMDDKLSQPDKDKIAKWLDEHMATQSCPACAFNEWVIEDSLGLVSLFGPGGTFVIGAGYPVVVVVCARCAYFRLHSAMAIGLVKPQSEVKDGSK